ncbi:MAG: zinc-dependent metalloprotease [Acidimicrobiia bacterium]|nr:zinc-dependent metalloprotease [Acidimicrobiia bacterium]
MSHDAPPSAVDWDLAGRVARVVAGRDPLSGSYLSASLERDFAEVTEEAESIVTGFTGLTMPGGVRSGVVDRHGWVAANIGSMKRLLAPLTDRLAERMSRSPFAPVGRRLAGAEMGVLLGYMGQRVLGQYDLLVPEASDTPDAVYYVGPNILTLEKRYAFRPRDFRLWIAVHEVTHRAQFTGVPWLRSYFLSLVEQSLELVEPDPKRLVRALGRASEELRAGRNPLDSGGLVALVATPEQQGIIGRMQALMSLLEGHGTWVMNRVGDDSIPGAERMDRVLHTRRRSRGLHRQFQRLLGIEMKLRQYEIGERFVAAVTTAAGPDVLEVAWRGPEWLPTMEELDDPTDWLQRVEVPALAAPGGR